MGTLRKASNDFYFLRGGGEMGELTRAKDWAQTVLGNPESWPPGLCTTVAMMLDNPFGMYIAWGKEYIQLYNDGFRPILGSSKHPQALGISTRETFSEIWETIGPMFDGVMQGTAVGFPDFMVPLNRNGYVEECYFDFSYSPIRKENGEVGGVLVTVIETTEKKKAIDALKESEERFRIMAETAKEGEMNLRSTVLHAPIGICILDADTLVSEIVNDSFVEVAGKPIEAIQGKYYWDTFAETRPYYESALKQVVEEGITYYANEVELMLIRHGREEMIFVTFVYAPLKNTDGKVKKVAIWIFENTRQVVARRRIEEAEEKARLAINSADLGLYEIEYATDTMTTDDRFKKIWGIENPDTTRKEYAMFIHPDDMLHRERAHAESLQTGQLDYQARVIWKDRSIHWMRITGKVLYDETHKPLKLIGVAQDITTTVIAQKKIEESEKTIRTMILQAPVAMCIFRGPSYTVEIANNKMYELWGKPSEEILGKPIFEGLPEAKEQGLEQLLEHVFNTGDRFEAFERPVNLPRNGKIETVYVNFVYEALQRSDTSNRDILAVAIDVTPQVIARLQIEDVVAERTKELFNANSDLQKSNDELAQFAYIASHDLQEPLRKISIFSQLLEKSMHERMDEVSRNYLDKINNSSTRMNRLIKDVLAYSQLVKESEIFAEVDLNRVIKNIQSDYDLLIEQKGAIIKYANLPVIEAIPLQMAQLFGNLIGNALKFAKKDPQPLLTISALKIESEEAAALSLLPDLEYYKIQFVDNGIGLKEEYAEQIFHIFQRLHRKSEYEGTGIGLAMCKKIALNHYGDINAIGSSEKGAVINVFLPVRQNQVRDDR